jgi:hypothetical protein
METKPCWIVTIYEGARKESLVYRRFDQAVLFIETHPLLMMRIQPAKFSDEFRIEEVEIET